MTGLTHDDPDADPFDGLKLEGVQRSDEYTLPDGWIVSLHVPDDATLRLVLDRWGP